jgi:hypothetical protein
MSATLAGFTHNGGGLHYVTLMNAGLRPMEF